MRNDVLIDDVLAKCDVLKRSGLWPGEPRLRPRAWLNNFDEADRAAAAILLDRFTFYNSRLTDSLLLASFNSIVDGLTKGPLAPGRTELISSLSSARFTPVLGEDPNPTDSGNIMCRRLRQLLGVPDSLVLGTGDALTHAASGGTVIFVDDFVGSGDQFLSTWQRVSTGRMSFESIQAQTAFPAVYVTLIATAVGLGVINAGAPKVAVSVVHVIEEDGSLAALFRAEPTVRIEIERLLEKYSVRLRPREEYIANNPEYLKYGFKNRGLTFGFEHSIPDATLPIFWSPGENNWEPLIERT